MGTGENVTGVTGSPQLEETSEPIGSPALAVFPTAELLDRHIIPGLEGVAGPGSMLLLHGFGDRWDQLRFIGDALCPEAAVAVYPTLRGHGSSPSPLWGYGPLDFCADLQRIADTFPDRFHIVGFSYGALIGVLTALTWAADRVESVVVLDQSFGPQPARHARDIAQVPREELRGQDFETSLLRWHFDYRHCVSLLGAIAIPALFVIGNESHVVPEAERQALRARRSPGFSCVNVTGTHAGMLEDREGLIDVLRRFYRDHATTVRQP